MPYCPRCGVETDPSVRFCPLCATEIPSLSSLPGEPAWPPSYSRDLSLDPAKVYATSSELRSRAFLTITAVFVTAAVAVTGADLFTTGAVTWARWPLLSLAAAEALSASVFLWHRRPAVWGTLWALVTGLLLTAFDFCDGAFDWAVPLGLPVTAITFGLAAAGVAIVRRSQRLGLNLFGLVPALGAVELLAIDLLVTRWLTGQLIPGWSVVTSLVLVPLALLLYFLHYALRWTPDLRRIFHL